LIKKIIEIILNFVGCSLNTKKKKEVNLKEYKGAVLCGRQLGSAQTGRVSIFKKGMIYKSETYMRSVLARVQCYDTIK
jgi:hypothetical protein